MVEERPTRRRWFQFSLRTFLLVTIFVGFGGAWVGMQLQQKRRHESVVDAILKAGGAVDFSDAGEILAWQEWLFGSYAVKPVELTFSRQPQGHFFGTIAAEPEKLSWEEGVNTASLLSQVEGMNLISLNLDLTEITDAELEHVKGFTSLKSLSLDNTQITDAGLTHLKGIFGLERLSLRNTKITDAGLTSLHGLNSLKSLDLSNSQVTDAGLLHLKRLHTLKYLCLENTHLTDHGLIHLKALTSLEDLDLSNNQLTDAGVASLEKALPNVFILDFSSE